MFVLKELENMEASETRQKGSRN